MGKLKLTIDVRQAKKSLDLINKAIERTGGDMSVCWPPFGNWLNWEFLAYYIAFKMFSNQMV